MKALKPLLVALGLAAGTATVVTATHPPGEADEADATADGSGVLGGAPEALADPTASVHAPVAARGMERDLEGTDLFI